MGLLGGDDNDIFHAELSRRLQQLRVMGIDTQVLELLLHDALQAKPKTAKPQVWMVEPMNYRIR